MNAPLEIRDPSLGILRFDRLAWRGDTRSGVPIFVEAGKDGPDASLRQAAVTTIQRLPELESRARAFLERTAPPERPWPHLTLVAAEVFRPHADWVRREVAPSHPAAAQAILGGAPAVSLEFAIAGERDVVDVVFFENEPVAGEYH